MPSLRPARHRRIAIGLATAALLASSTTAPAGAGPADDRFEQLDGPMAPFVVRPEQFGMDPARTLVAVEPLLDRVDGDRALSLVESLAFPRSAYGPESARQQARDLVSAAFVDAGYQPSSQSVVYEPTGIDSPNLWADLPGTECPGKVLVVGGHYDSVEDGPGADDNASGVAGMIEVARALRDTPLPVTARLAAWSYEEVGLVGSGEMARQMAADGTEVVGAIAFDMIGFTKPGIDPLTGFTNDYLAMVADPSSAAVARAFGAAAYHYTPEFAAAGAVIDPAVLGDILRSDHAAFLAQGYTAMLVTDTGDFRNPNYHTPADTPDTLDPAFLAGSIRSTLAGLVTYASSDQDGDGRSDLCHPPAPTEPPETEVPTDGRPEPTPATSPAPAPAATARRASPAYTG